MLDAMCQPRCGGQGQVRLRDLKLGSNPHPQHLLV